MMGTQTEYHQVMMKTRTPAQGIILEPKSQVSRLTREIDGLVRQYVTSGKDDFAHQASKLSRQREDLLKPDIIRTGKIKKAG